MAMAATVATSVSRRCWEIAPSMSARWAIQKLISVTGGGRHWRHCVKEQPNPRIAGASDDLRGIKRHEASLIQDPQLGSERKGFTHVVRHHDDGLVELFLNAVELVMQFGARERIERPERLIHQDHWRVSGKRPCEPH